MPPLTNYRFINAMIKVITICITNRMICILSKVIRMTSYSDMAAIPLLLKKAKVHS